MQEKIARCSNPYVHFLILGSCLHLLNSVCRLKQKHWQSYNTALYASELSHSIMLPFNSAHAFIGIFLDFFMAFSLAKLLWYLVF